MPRDDFVEFSRWPSLRVEGNLIAPAMLAKVATQDASEQAPEDYSVRKGLTLREEISTAFRVGQSHYRDFVKLDTASQASTLRFVQAFLAETFAFNGVVTANGRASLIIDDRVPVVVVPPVESLEQRSQLFSSDRARSPSLALQEHLSDPNKGAWGLATNGNSIRLMRDNASMTRPAFIEADIEQMFMNEDISSFSMLWLTIHRSRFGLASRPATECTLENWRNDGAAEGEVIRGRLADQVKKALTIVGSGFLSANPRMREFLKSGEIEITDWFNELLGLVYRLIFIMVAEDRGLLHSKNTRASTIDLYEDGYSLKHLRKRCIRASSWSNHLDIYEGIKIVFRSLSDGEGRLGLPALGGLFEKDSLLLIGNAYLPNYAIMKAIYKLSWLSETKYGITPINWRAMETEELGSVYESLLELQPQLSDDGLSLSFASDSVESQGSRRKTTGSYYTPDSLVQQLLDSTLDPVLDSIESSSENPADAMLDISVIDPACGSGHFLLGATRRIATRVARLNSDGNPNPLDYRNALREVVRRCIFGVDVNPMAVELAKVALWIETISPGFPLGLLDAQIRCGNSILGLLDLNALKEGVPATAYKPLTEDLENTCAHYKKINHDTVFGQGQLDYVGGGGAMPAENPMVEKLVKLRSMTENSIKEVNMKARKLAEIEQDNEFMKVKNASNLYVSAFLTHKNLDLNDHLIRNKIPTTEDVWKAIEGRELDENLARPLKVAQEARAFHWPVTFSDIMENGGFDVVIGNPPWERIKLEETQYFAVRHPDIASAPNASVRKKMIENLKASQIKSERNIYKKFAKAKRASEAVSEFVRVSAKHAGRFPHSGRGDVNTYLLFAELFSQLIQENGRAGLIVPTGIATDATAAPFFGWLIKNNRLASLFDFENRNRIFPNIDSRIRFSLVTIGRSESEACFSFFLTDTSDIFESERNFTLTPSQIATINPNTNTTPVFRSRKDADLAAEIFSNVPVLINEKRGLVGNTWGTRIFSMFHMAGDSGYFITAKDFDDGEYDHAGKFWIKNDVRYVPLYEAKMIHQYDHRWASFKDGKRKEFYNLESYVKKDSNFEPSPRYWISDEYVEDRLEGFSQDQKWLIGCRNITGATNERTTIFSVIPRCGVGHSMSVMFTSFDPVLSACLIANMNSIVLDYFSRQAISGNNMSQYFIKQFPILPPEYYNDRRRKFVSERVLKLVYTSHVLKAFACDLNYDGTPFEWNELERRALMSDIDAFYFRAYGFNRDEVRYVIDPADVMGPDYPSETFRVLKENELSSFNEYRTQRLILEAWDRMESNGEFAEMDM